jgi:hypothetical protein
MNEQQLRQDLKKRFTQKFFFENEGWINAILKRFKKEVRKHIE